MGQRAAQWAPAAVGVALALTLGWLAVASARPALPATPVNSGFEEVVAGAPAGWTLSGAPGFKVASVAGEAGQGARLYLAVSPATGGPGNAFLSQEIDASPYRGKLVRLSAELKVDQPGSHAGIAMRIQRPQPNFAGFHYDMEDKPAPARGWTRYEITGRVAADAESIWIGMGVSGDGDATIDTVSIEVVEPNAAAPSPEAKAYLDRAIELARANHIDSARVDWPRVTADAHAEIGGAKTTGDTYNAIRGVIGAIGNKHTMFLPKALTEPSTPAAAKAASSVLPPQEMPSWQLDGRLGVVRLPALATFGPEGQKLGQRYSETLRTGLETMDKAPICGWIVDLRGNTGGNMWPMLQGLDPLLGKGPFGAFVDTAQHVTLWQRAGGQVTGGTAAGDAPASFALTHAAAPLAILIDGRTWSSGEMTAIAFIGRPGVRVFGAPSGNYTTANYTYSMSDGALLILTTAYVRDRTGKDYRSAIEPDEQAAPAEVAVAAKKWLQSQCPAAA